MSAGDEGVEGEAAWEILGPIWEVVGGTREGGIKVRQGKETLTTLFDQRLRTGARIRQLALAGNRLHYERLSSEGPETGWVSIRFEGKDLVRKVEEEPVPAAPARVLAGDVLDKLEAELVSSSSGEGGAGFLPVGLAEGASGGEATPGTDEATVQLTPAAKDWLAQAREWLRRFNPKVEVPGHVRLPAAAVNWEPAAGVLFVLTHGHFDPERDVRDARAVPAGGENGLVSVAVATTDRRRSFHQLVYENFKRQKYEPRELVVVHSGEEPSELFMQLAEEDPQVVYRFFPVTTEAPGSPRLSDEKMGNPWASVLQEDDPAELTHWHPGNPWKYEISRDGWTKGLKRNIACCVARGSAIVHFDEACLYAPEYLGSMLAKLRDNGGTHKQPAAITLSTWYTMGVADREFRLVDLREREELWEQYGQNARSAQNDDQFNHGFVYVFTRTAWEEQPFPEVETVGTQDSGFLKALQRSGVRVGVVSGGPDEAAACGWHRDATCGAKDAPANINHSQVLTFMMFRGKEATAPWVFKPLLPMVKEVADELLKRREAYLRELVEEHGSVQVCANCNFAVAKVSKMNTGLKLISTSREATDAYAQTVTYDKFHQKFEVGEWAQAGGAVAEGHWQRPPSGHTWLNGCSERMAICRNCGWQLGWRYEPAGAPKECQTPGCLYLASGTGRAPNYCSPKCEMRGAFEDINDSDRKKSPLPKGPVFWGFIWRHLRLRTKAGELVPLETDKDFSRHKETSLNARRRDVCPQGHLLRHFCTGQGNGGAPALYYICDVCDRPARGAQHMWGCGTCDYDICDGCRSKRS